MKIILIFLGLNIYTVISSECNGKKTKNIEDCSELNDKGKYPDLCCLFQKYKKEDGKFDEEGECKTVPYSSYYEGYLKEYIGEDLYNVTCIPNTIIQTFTLEKCGNIYNKNPSKKDCKKYSSYVDSCCYYSGENKKDDPLIEGANFEKGCYWLGSKYEGSIFWAGARLECSYKFLKYSLFSLLYLIISL